MKNSYELLYDFLQFFIPIVKQVLEKILIKERNMYLQNNPHIKANGF